MHVKGLIMRSAYGDTQGYLCKVSSVITKYLIFKNVLIVYGIILESTDVT